MSEQPRRGQVPKYVLDNLNLRTARQFKALKRTQLRTAMKAIMELRKGCAYTPDGPRIMEAVAKHLDQFQSFLSVRKWGK